MVLFWVSVLEETGCISTYKKALSYLSFPEGSGNRYNGMTTQKQVATAEIAS
jgi:hypothetical protein